MNTFAIKTFLLVNSLLVYSLNSSDHEPDDELRSWSLVNLGVSFKTNSQDIDFTDESLRHNIKTSDAPGSDGEDSDTSNASSIHNANSSDAPESDGEDNDTRNYRKPDSDHAIVVARNLIGRPRNTNQRYISNAKVARLVQKNCSSEPSSKKEKNPQAAAGQRSRASNNPRVKPNSQLPLNQNHLLRGKRSDLSFKKESFSHREYNETPVLNNYNDTAMTVMAMMMPRKNN